MCYQKQVVLETDTVKYIVEYNNRDIQRKPSRCILVTASVIGWNPFPVSVDLLDAREDGFFPQHPPTPTLVSAAISHAYFLPKLACTSSFAPLNLLTLIFNIPTDILNR